jgi:hypothetical protein
MLGWNRNVGNSSWLNAKWIRDEEGSTETVRYQKGTSAESNPCTPAVGSRLFRPPGAQSCG